MTTTIFRCQDCEAILVISTKDLWKLGKCPRCESKNLVNLDEEFDKEVNKDE